MTDTPTLMISYCEQCDGATECHHIMKVEEEDFHVSRFCPDCKIWTKHWRKHIPSGTLICDIEQQDDN